MKNEARPISIKVNPMHAKLGVTAGVTAILLAITGGCATTPAEPVSEKLDPDTATTVTVLTQPIELMSSTARSKQTDPFAYIAPFETNRMGSRDLFLWVSTPQAQGQLAQPQVMCNGQLLSLEPAYIAGADSPGVSSKGGPGGSTSLGGISGGAGANAAGEANAAGGANTGSGASTAGGTNTGSTAGNPIRPSGPLAAPGDNVVGGTTSGPPVKIDLARLSLSRAPYDSPVPWSTQWYFRLPNDSLKCLADADGILLLAPAADGASEQFTPSSRKELASLDAFTRR